MNQNDVTIYRLLTRYFAGALHSVECRRQQAGHQWHGWGGVRMVRHRREANQRSRAEIVRLLRHHCFSDR